MEKRGPDLYNTGFLTIDYFSTHTLTLSPTIHRDTAEFNAEIKHSMGTLDGASLRNQNGSRCFVSALAAVIFAREKFWKRI